MASNIFKKDMENKKVKIDDKEINYMIQIPSKIFKDIKDKKVTTTDFTVLGCVLGLVNDNTYDMKDNEFISHKTKVSEEKIIKSINRLSRRGYLNNIKINNN